MSPNTYISLIKEIEQQLDDDWNIDRLSRKVCVSKFHFHRQFSALFGIPVMSCIRLLKLKRAAYRLAYRDMKEPTRLIDIAIEAGFETHESFTRAFKKVFQLTPSQFRRSPEWSSWHSHYQPILELRTTTMSVLTSYNVEITDFEGEVLAVMQHRGAPHLLPQTIRAFIEWRKQNRLPPSKSATYNLVYDDPRTTEPDDFKFDLGCTVKGGFTSNNENIVLESIPAGRCAKIIHKGSDESLAGPIEYLYSTWLLTHEYKALNFPMFLKRVQFFPDVPEHEALTEIYLLLE